MKTVCHLSHIPSSHYFISTMLGLSTSYVYSTVYFLSALALHILKKKSFSISKMNHNEPRSSMFNQSFTFHFEFLCSTDSYRITILSSYIIFLSRLSAINLTRYWILRQTEHVSLNMLSPIVCSWKKLLNLNSIISDLNHVCMLSESNWRFNIKKKYNKINWYHFIIIEPCCEG